MGLVVERGGKMIRQNQKYLNILQVILDMLTILGAFLVSYYIRFFLMKDGIITLDFGRNILPILAMLPIYFILYSMFDLYNSRRIRPFTQEVYSLTVSNLLGFLILTLGLFLFDLSDFSRYNLGLFLFFTISGSLFVRGSIRYILRRYRQKGFNLKHCIIVGTSPTASQLLEKIKTHPYWGYNILGIVRSDTRKSNAFGGHRILGNIEDLSEILGHYYADVVLIATDENNAEQLGIILKACETSGVKTHIIPYYHKYVPAKPYIDDLDGLPIIDTRHVPLDNPFRSFAKRCFDIVFSVVALILTSPLLLFCAIMIKCSSPGPIFFKQERVGTNRKNFLMYKFRSMRVQTDEEELDKWTTKDDPRKTWWGSFMRRTSIDELPQFINVLKGEMSVVGPRPERPFFVEKFKQEVPRYMIKHQVRPGITGWAQVNGYRGDTSIEERITHDLYYIENWTMSFDFKIIFLTVFKGFINKNAY